MDRANADFRQALRNAAQRSGVSAFWRWWLGALAPLVPIGLSNAWRRRRLRPALVFARDAAVLWVPGVVDGALAFREAASIPLAGDSAAAASAGRAAIDALPRAARGGSAAPARVVVALPAGQVLRKTITLPEAAEESLRQVLAYDLDRHTPFKPDEVYFDAVVAARDPVKKEIRVDWAAALKTVVDQARRRAESFGAVVVGVAPELPVAGAAVAGTALNLLPDEERPDAGAWRRWEIWIPLALVVAVALVAIALPVWQKRNYTIAVAQLAEQARVQAEAANALRAQLEQLTGDYNFVLQRKYAFPSALQVVDDVTRLLPDDTWLTQFEVKSAAKGKDPHREILIRGESANAGRLVSLLEDSKLFEQAAPRSPTTKIQPGPGEIFDLGAELKPLPPPPPVLVAEAPGAATAPVAGTPASGPAALPAGAPEAAPTAAAPAPNATAPSGTAPVMRSASPSNPAAPSTPAPAPGAVPPSMPAALSSASPGAGAAPPAKPGPPVTAAPTGAAPPAKSGPPVTADPNGAAPPATPGPPASPTTSPATAAGDAVSRALPTTRALP